MSELIRSITRRLRGLISERRHARRHQAQRKARLLFSVSLLDAERGHEAAHLWPLEGYTRDISETGVGLVVPSFRLGEHHLTDPHCTLRIVLLDLPIGQVEMRATPVRYQPLKEEGAEGYHLIGVRITAISDSDRARLVAYLQTL